MDSLRSSTPNPAGYADFVRSPSASGLGSHEADSLLLVLSWARPDSNR
ncbi:MAG: hypothetical protein HY556_06190 [Euryarchaeota archaeon]|nr:hypothetical protein [Euryarchaeota archaeon]